MVRLSFLACLLLGTSATLTFGTELERFLANGQNSLQALTAEQLSPELQSSGARAQAKKTQRAVAGLPATTGRIPQIIHAALFEPAAIFGNVISTGPGPEFAQLIPPSKGVNGANSFTVDGIVLGSRPNLDAQTYRDYQCQPSEQFDSYTVCQKTLTEKEKRGAFRSFHSMLHSQDGTAVYINRFQEPAFFDANEAQDDIDRYSRRIGQTPKILRMRSKPGFPTAVLASWGKVLLEPLDGDDVKLLAEGKNIKRGYLIDFLGNFIETR